MLAITTDGYNIWYSPSCSATFISITINHSSLLKNMKGCNLNFPQRFSLKKKQTATLQYPGPDIALSTGGYLQYIKIGQSDLLQTTRGKFVKTTSHDRMSSEAPGLMLSTLLHLLVVHIRSTRSLSNVNISLVGPCSGSELANIWAQRNLNKVSPLSGLVGDIHYSGWRIN